MQQQMPTDELNVLMESYRAPARAMSVLRTLHALYGSDIRNILLQLDTRVRAGEVRKIVAQQVWRAINTSRR